MMMMMMKMMKRCVLVTDCVMCWSSDTGLHPQHGHDQRQDRRGNLRGESVGGAVCICQCASALMSSNHRSSHRFLLLWHLKLFCVLIFCVLLSALDEILFNQGHNQRRHPGEFNTREHADKAQSLPTSNIYSCQWHLLIIVFPSMNWIN